MIKNLEPLRALKAYKTLSNALERGFGCHADKTSWLRVVRAEFEKPNDPPVKGTLVVEASSSLARRHPRKRGCRSGKRKRERVRVRKLPPARKPAKVVVTPAGPSTAKTVVKPAKSVPSRKPKSRAAKPKQKSMVDAKEKRSLQASEPPYTASFAMDADLLAPVELLRVAVAAPRPRHRRGEKGREVKGAVCTLGSRQMLEITDLVTRVRPLQGKSASEVALSTGSEAEIPPPVMGWETGNLQGRAVGTFLAPPLRRGTMIRSRG
ncbi:hypothetical protein FB45DRAFT_874492 [Roridomyces roridus]|uniref:Uncharacterized protein n=1 Tax=Roridomyces roridus TaxID=1738132 RepID=A0AAD7B8T7_9AGAR|nr:hypothetical protein FB45DRAFT_874492 [Roridomyces roridus]